MLPDATDWKELTPNQLIPAIEHVRKMFDKGVWKCTELTKRLCYSTLHPQDKEQTSLALYETAFADYRRAIGARSWQNFDDLMEVGTPPAVFKAYLYVYAKGLEANIRDHFEEVVQSGLANSPLLKIHPAEWAKSHLKLLIKEHSHKIKIWIQEVCDKREQLKDASEAEIDELIYWKAWRAPKLIHMQPSGNTPFDPAAAWTRENERTTNQVLEALSQRFLQSLRFHLDD